MGSPSPSRRAYEREKGSGRKDAGLCIRRKLEDRKGGRKGVEKGRRGGKKG